MQTNRRWLRSILDESDAPSVALPWQRGDRRKDSIARRTGISAVKALAYT